MPPPPLAHIKLIRLAELAGFPTKEALLSRYIGDVIVPGICTNPGCDYKANVEAYQPEGYCELEGTHTPKLFRHRRTCLNPRKGARVRHSMLPLLRAVEAFRTTVRGAEE